MTSLSPSSRDRKDMTRQDLVYKLADEVVQEHLSLMHDWLKPDDYERLEKAANEFLFEGVKRALYAITRELGV